MIFIPEILNDNVATDRKVDDGSVKQLIDMGFPENRARKALIVNK